MADGWIKIPQIIKKQWFYKNINTRLVYFHILVNTDEEGLCRTSMADLSHSCKLTKEQTRYALKLLEEGKNIKYWRSGNSTIVEVASWNSFRYKEE